MKVRNMRGRSGNNVPNQFIISDGNTTYFQSYQTIIAKRVNGEVILDDSALDYSRTTSKYLYQFLGISGKKNVQNMIDNGTFKTQNLN